MDGWIGYKMVGSRAEQTSISLRNVGSTSRTGGPGCGWERDTWSQPLLANQKVCASVARSCLRGTVCVCSRLLACPRRIRVWHFHRSTTAPPRIARWPLGHRKAQCGAAQQAHGPRMFTLFSGHNLSWPGGMEICNTERKDLTQSFFSVQ
jgi:hypothetical protein